jgi:hypothetical protein
VDDTPPLQTSNLNMGPPVGRRQQRRMISGIRRPGAYGLLDRENHVSAAPTGKEGPSRNDRTVPYRTVARHTRVEIGLCTVSTIAIPSPGSGQQRPPKKGVIVTLAESSSTCSHKHNHAAPFVSYQRVTVLSSLRLPAEEKKDFSVQPLHSHRPWASRRTVHTPCSSTSSQRDSGWMLVASSAGS